MPDCFSILAEKEAKIQATIFGDNVAHYDKAVKFGKEYEISNARIKHIKEQYRTTEEEYEMEFVDTTIIRPLFQASSRDDVPEYCDIGAIPHIVESEDRHGKDTNSLCS
uniref:Replication protein A 70 kDa DNA-binding subunit B/D first OB fold domain-containing protein n=1 Tax=Opuntia streptacantha TaxID=393608 RepID=A0A7C8ZUK9_OPUST